MKKLWFPKIRKTSLKFKNFSLSWIFQFSKDILFICLFIFIRRRGNRFDKRNRLIKVDVLCFILNFKKESLESFALFQKFQIFSHLLSRQLLKRREFEKRSGKKNNRITGVLSTKIFVVENFLERFQIGDVPLRLLENENRIPIARIFPFRFHFQREARVSRCRISKKIAASLKSFNFYKTDGNHFRN